MKGVIHIDTALTRHEMHLETTLPQEIYDKSRQLKESVGLTTDTPFVVWMQLPSKMNEPEVLKDGPY